MSTQGSTGFVIALDGPDGVGKTTQVKLLSDFLKQKGHHVHLTRNAGGTPIGEALRKVSLSELARPAETDLFISLAMGAALSVEVQERKARGEVIIIDRSPLAVVAYNGFGSQLDPLKPAFDACTIMFQKLGIDLLLFLSASPMSLRSRRESRGTEDYFEKQDTAFHDRVNAGYIAALEHVQSHAPHTNVIKIDADGAIDSIQADIQNAIESVIKL